MNIKNILNFMLVKYNTNGKVDNEILKQIEDVMMEIESAECMFNSVSDPKLIEAAIYRSDAAKKRYDYLISLAKKKYKEQVLEV